MQQYKGEPMNKIFEYRKENNLTQDDFLFDLNRAGLHCTKSDISRWERGKCIPNSDARYVLADILKISEYELFVNIILNLDYKHYQSSITKRRGSKNANTG